MRRVNFSYEAIDHKKDVHMRPGVRIRNIVLFGILFFSPSFSGKAEAYLENWVGNREDNGTFPIMEKEETTMSWVEFMELDALDVDANDTFNEYDKPTIPWLLFMEIDRVESEKEISRLKRDSESGDGSGEASGSGTTTSPDITTVGDTTTTITEEVTGTSNIELTTPEFFTNSGTTQEMTLATETTEASGDLSTYHTEFTTVPFDNSTAIETTVSITERTESSGVTPTELTTSEITTVTGSGTSSTAASTDNVTSTKETTTHIDTTESSGVFPTDITTAEISTVTGSGATPTNSVASTTMEITEETTAQIETTESSGVFPTDITTAEISTVTGSGATPTNSLASITMEITEETTTQIGGCANDDECPGPNDYCFSPSDHESSCTCLPGFTKENGSCTSEVRQFGGKLHLELDFDDDLLDKSSGLYTKFKDQYDAFLEAAYQPSGWTAMVISFEPGSTIVNYEVQVDASENVTTEDVQETFDSFIESNNSYYQNCSCNSMICNSTDPSYPPLQANFSCEDAGTLSPCESAAINDSCSHSTVMCSAEDGLATCVCIDVSQTYQSDERVCIGPVCEGNCNSPFGTCTASGTCDCMWGFYGDNCDNPWLFTLIIVICGLVLIVIIIGVILYFKRRRTRKKYYRNATDYYDDIIRQSEGVSRKSNARHYRAADWDTNTGVVATSYKKMEDEDENVQQSTYGEPVPLTTFQPNPYENAGYEGREEDQRVKELVEETSSRGRGANDNKVFVDDEIGEVKNGARGNASPKIPDEPRYARTPL